MGEMIIPVCKAIWYNLQPLVLPEPTEEMWRYQAQGFDQKWNFPHCLGAIDGKHVRMYAPPNSGSLFYNYKGYFSTTLLAITGFDYRFIYVHVGSYGKAHDSGIFNTSEFCMRLSGNDLHVPPPARLPNDAPDARLVPHFFLGDDAFKMTTSIVKGYPHPPADKKKAVFNYRVSRARRVVENSFGILTQRWRIYLRSMQVLPERADWIVKATVVLHNLLTSKCDRITQDVHNERVEIEEANGMGNLARSTATNSTRGAKELQVYLTDYINDPNRGAVSWQNRSANVNN